MGWWWYSFSMSVGSNYQKGVAHRFLETRQSLTHFNLAQFPALTSSGHPVAWDAALCANTSKSGPTHHEERKGRRLSWVKPEQHYQALVFGQFSPFPTVCVAFDDTGSPCKRHFAADTSDRCPLNPDITTSWKSAVTSSMAEQNKSVTKC